MTMAWRNMGDTPKAYHDGKCSRTAHVSRDQIAKRDAVQGLLLGVAAIFFQLIKTAENDATPRGIFLFSTTVRERISRHL
jgi:hypothetical protein